VTLQDLPGLNATLNAAAAMFLTAGYALVRARRVRAHIVCMVAALACSAVFLASYLYYHFHVGSVRFPPLGWVRTVYLGILLTHTLLAAIVPPLAYVTVIRALRGQHERHRRIARVTLPIWLYVSATGVAVYWMLYRLSPRLLAGG
jgi:uncharacterized membrane protein YozB (DUF420 family)